MDDALEPLATVADVITALDGVGAVCRLTGRGPSAVSMWKHRGNFSPETFVVLNDALRAKGLVAPASLWRMAEARAS